VRGACIAVFSENTMNQLETFPNSITAAYTATTTVTTVLGVRVARVFNSKVNIQGIALKNLSIGVETTSRILRVEIHVNVVPTGTLNWQSISATSMVEYSTANIASPFTGVSPVAQFLVASATPSSINLVDLGIELFPNDTLFVTLVTVSQTAITNVSLNWIRK
jgi:hypothetical protein